MSGGAFDYQQYHITDIIDRIEREVIASSKEYEKKTKIEVWVCEMNGSWKNWYKTPFKNIEEAKKQYKFDGYHIKMIDENTFEACSPYDIKKVEQNCEEIYIDEEGEEIYVPEWSQETIDEFKKGIEILKKANIYVNKIDYLLCGDYGEENFHKKLKEELDEFENESGKEKTNN